jgi:hypothetical protein
MGRRVVAVRWRPVWRLAAPVGLPVGGRVEARAGRPTDVPAGGEPAAGSCDAGSCSVDEVCAGPACGALVFGPAGASGAGAGGACRAAAASASEARGPSGVGGDGCPAGAVRANWRVPSAATTAGMAALETDLGGFDIDSDVKSSKISRSGAAPACSEGSPAESARHQPASGPDAGHGRGHCMVGASESTEPVGGDGSTADAGSGLGASDGSGSSPPASGLRSPGSGPERTSPACGRCSGDSPGFGQVSSAESVTKPLHYVTGR